VNVETGTEWRRLDPRMLLVDPIKTMSQFALPFLITLVGLGSQDPTWSLVALPAMLAGAVAIGVLPWLTTRYRITDTQLQVRRGLLQKTTLTAPLDRIRSVDLEASLLRRVLSLTKVEIGTGVDDSRISLDALSVEQGDELRRFLLARRADTTVVNADSTTDAGKAVPIDADEPTELAPVELATVDWAWLKFAPFSLSRLVIVAGAAGVLAQFGENLPFVNSESLSDAWEWVLDQAIPLLLGVVAVGALVGWILISVGGYVIQWWNLRLVREAGNLRLTAGLFTTRSTSVEEKRVRGVQLVEPALLRLIGGAELRALATGVGSGGVTKLLPPSPVEVNRRVGHDVLEAADPLVMPLQRHGAAARRRCHARAQWSTLAAVAVAVAASIAFDLPWWLPIPVVAVVAVIAALAGEAAYRQLGHGLLPEHLVAANGVLLLTRTALERDGIIGWVIRQSYFQRRVGLATLVATTAAGAERVVIRDLDYGRAVALADASTPGVLTPFL
jgi:putative membrane protein